MKSLWDDAEAEALVAAYAEAGVGRDLALRVYTTRLLGSDPRLVLHGGGNTSLKTVETDLFGDEVAVLRVKGSGWDMARIEPAGLPAVRLALLRRLIAREAVSDADMVNAQRLALLDAGAPNPSVEALLHAVLAPRYVDHTHADAVLALTDQPDGEARALDLWGDRMAVIPYVMPGFALAKAVAEAEIGDAEGLILMKHGAFTVGEDARESYERMIEMVTLAEEEIGRIAPIPAVALPRRIMAPAEAAPILRGVLGCAGGAPWVLAFRGGEDVLEFVNGEDLPRYAQAGVTTPDYVIRTKRTPLITPPADADNPTAFREGTETALQTYIAAYHDYFARHAADAAEPKRERDPLPRVVLVPGLGLLAVGRNAGEAAIVADLAECALGVIRAAETVGRFAPIGEAETFAVEYWSLEQAKLGRAARPALAGRVAVVTGGASGIGAATARALAAEGAEIAILDRDLAGAEATAAAIGGAALALRCDVTDGEEIAFAFARIVEAFGGLDIVVSNAGAAWQGRIGEVDEATLDASFALNFFAHQRVAQRAVRVMRAQGTGGVLLFNASKQALDPGPEFGPYGLAKAATIALMRQYAIDYGADGIRSNAVNADRIRSGLLSDDMIAARSKARRLSEHDYMAGNLLGREVLDRDVAAAFVDLALAPATTGAVLTVDGGNVAAMMR